MRLISLLLLLMSTVSSLANPCADHLNPILQTARTQILTFTNVEVFRRNNNVGLQQIGDLRISKWIDLTLPEDGTANLIGISEQNGRVYHVIKLRDRTIARLLSGRRQIQDIYFYRRSSLIAIDSQNQVLAYFPAAWMKSPLKALLKQGLLTWGGATTLMTATLAGTTQTDLSALPAIAGYVGISATLTTLFPLLYRFEQFNTFPDGFMPLGFSSANSDDLSGQLKNHQDKLKTLDPTHFDVPENIPPLVPEPAREDLH